MTMCRALMEHILKKYYSFQAENLEKIIALAEEKFPNLKSFLCERKKRRRIIFSMIMKKNQIQRIKSVIDFLKTIKYLVQQIPTKRK